MRLQGQAAHIAGVRKQVVNLRLLGLVGWSRLGRADDSRILVGRDMRLIAMGRRPALMFCPSRLAIPLGGRAGHGGIDRRAFAQASAFLLEIERNGFEQALSETARGKQMAEANECRALRRCLAAGKATKAAEPRAVFER